ncbi:MAG TPA: L,D-transpeptidase family protein [Chthoniobacterales bacterium]|nr:L,D-transpeptidase family protein [Chthoniobacterales bacterium]
MRLVTLLLLSMSAASVMAATSPLDASRQCIVVIGRDWGSTTGILKAFERPAAGGQWKLRGGAVPVVLGKRGMAWGVGLFGANQTAPRKTEGDNKVPAGIFRVGPAFGYAASTEASWVKLKYVPLTAETEGIDDPRSRYYNRLVERSKVARVDWRSSEQMRRKDDLYKWGIVVDHNPAAIPGAGSCIFFHIWKNSRSATAGCTAMPERDLVNLLRWLEPVARPLLVQMPRRAYEALQPKLNLPALPR